MILAAILHCQTYANIYGQNDPVLQVKMLHEWIIYCYNTNG